MKKHNIIIPENVYPKPTIREISAAYILAEYFNADVKFIPRSNQKTPDFQIKNLHWELKTPTGVGKRNIQHVISKALKQSRYIIVDARFSKIHIAKIKSRLLAEMKVNRRIERLILIDKQKNVVEIFR